MTHVDPTQALLRHLDRSIDEDLAERHTFLTAISGDTEYAVAAARTLLSRGKRLRPQFCYWGWRAVADNAPGNILPQVGIGDGELAAVLQIAQGLEYFHASALVHDDIIDRSDSRRGQPSAHRYFEQIVDESTDAGRAEHFGISEAILLGDMLLNWSHEMFSLGMARPFPAERKPIVRSRIQTMCTEVMAGQYLDVFAENAWPTRTPDEALTEALTILRYKSAKYSVEAPLLIGASVAGGTVGQLDALSRYGLALGEAFQLRDDILGVFGNPAKTGKPAGDDIREGKRTYLILLTRKTLPAPIQRMLDEALGDPLLDDKQIDAVKKLATQTGAVDAVERMIAERVETAQAALDEGGFPPEAHAELRALIDATAYRNR